MNTNTPHTQELLEHLLTAQTPDEMLMLLQNLLTPAEFSEICKRLQILKRLQSGMPQRKIAEELGVGIATVSRGARALKRDL
ncbi:Trp family transcriptional regulator [Nitrincola tapanii]|uniref:Transcriptional regulator n=1 Tax=Nitrincola tapanii TaxID=1708751 RepID=A0A5A9W163_9GAMM|nr:Trp family transcriptional regulator [Nitrincola tapanii]KAA0874293.1 transcriptional regulator [Nitrincola tapanii]